MPIFPRRLRDSDIASMSAEELQKEITHERIFLALYLIFILLYGRVLVIYALPPSFNFNIVLGLLIIIGALIFFFGRLLLQYGKVRTRAKIHLRP